jgi:hypothetical protein
MKSSDLKAGVFVKVLAGPYKDTEGVVEDVQPECSAVRIGTREGNAFALLDDLRIIPSPGEKAAVPSTPKPLVKGPILKK